MRLKLEQGKLIYIKPGKSDHMIKFGKANGQVYGLHTFTQSYVLTEDCHCPISQDIHLQDVICILYNFFYLIKLCMFIHPLKKQRNHKEICPPQIYVIIFSLVSRLFLINLWSLNHEFSLTTLYTACLNFYNYIVH